MRKKRFTPLIPLLFLGMLLLLFGAFAHQEPDIGRLEFRDRQRDLSLRLSYSQQEDTYYLFLPSFLTLQELELSVPSPMQAAISRGDTVYGSLAELPLDTPLTLTLSALGSREQTYPLKLMACSARQTICLTTREGTMEKIQADQTQAHTVSVALLDAAGEPAYQGYADLSGRGNGTWQWAKKPYDLRLPQSVDYGPFADVDKLCLFAEYTDRSMLRNALGYYTGEAMAMDYASGYAFADVYINGEYQGLYGLATKREYTRHIQSDGIRAVFEFYGYQKGNFFFTGHGSVLRSYYGSQGEIREAVDRFEQSLLARDWESLYRQMDLISWARKYAMDELFANYDLTLSSQYFYLDREGVIRCMLPWDYEWILYARLRPYDFREERVLAAWWNQGNWYDILLESEQFRQAVSRVLQEEFTPEFLEGMLRQLDIRADEIRGSWYCDIARWYGSSVWYNTAPAEADMEPHLKDLKEGLTIRADFLKELFADWEDYCLILFEAQIGEQRKQADLQLILPKGSDLTAYHQRILDSLRSLEVHALQLCQNADGIPLESISTVTEDMVITAVYAPAEAAQTPAQVPQSQPTALQRAAGMLKAYPIPRGTG